MRKLILILSFFFIVPHAHAAIAFDAFTAGVVAGTGTNQTFSHTTSGSNRLLVVLINQNGTDAVTGVTYNGVAMTQAIKKIITLGTSEAYIYYLINPTVGTNTVSVSESANPNQIDVDAISYTGVSQSFTPDTGFVQDLDTSAGGNFTATVNVTTANSWLVAMNIVSAKLATASVNATLRSANFNKNSVEDSNAGVSSGNQTIGYTFPTGTNTTTIISIAFPPVAVAVTPTSILAAILSGGWW